MKISYNWLKWYIPECPTSDKMYDIFTYHLCEVEGIEKHGDDTIFDINILPNRAHDLLSHQGIARELASLLNFKYVDPTSKYKIPESKPTNLKIKVDSDKCRRYMGRIVRNVNVGPSPDWVKVHLESIGQRSINNAVDGANITMYDCGQPIHCFDLDKVSGPLIIRMAKEDEEITTLDNKRVVLKTTDLVIADEKNVLAIAGVKGGKVAEVDENTKNIIIEVANFDPISARKTGRGAGIFTDALKRFENDLSPTLCDFAMLEMSGLFIEYGFTEFEDVVDTYPNKQEGRTLKFRKDKMSKMLGLNLKTEQIEDILTRYNFKFKNSDGVFDIEVPPMRLDLVIEEDMAEEIGRVLGYEKVENKIPKINFKPKVNNTFAMMSWARNKFLSEGYSEVMTYTFTNKGEVSVMQSPSDKKFLRTNLSDGLKESLKLNKLNLPLLDSKEVKVFEIGNVFKKDKEETHIAWSEKDMIVEKSLEEYCKEISSETFAQEYPASLRHYSQKYTELISDNKFITWSMYPFITRDIAVWVPDDVTSDEVRNLIKDNTGELVVKGPELFDQFKKDGKTSYAFRTVFQSQERTLTDAEINGIMLKIQGKIGEKDGWQVR